MPLSESEKDFLNACLEYINSGQAKAFDWDEVKGFIGQ